MMGASRAPHAAIVHPDEDLVDLVQYELERAGIATTAIVLDVSAVLRDSRAEADLIATLLPATPAVCVVAVAAPLRPRAQLLADLRGLWPQTRLVALTPTPSVVARWAGELVDACIPEALDLKQTVAATVALVRSRLALAQPLRGVGSSSGAMKRRSARRWRPAPGARSCGRHPAACANGTARPPDREGQPCLLGCAPPV